MTEKRETALKFRVGVFVLIALATFLAGVYALGARARLFEARYTIHADFTEVGGLVEGATVRLAGVQIGRVTAVNLPPTSERSCPPVPTRPRTSPRWPTLFERRRIRSTSRR